VGNYLAFDGLSPGDSIDVRFPIEETTASYTVSTQTPEEETYACTFRGGTLVDISPRDEAETSYRLYHRAGLRAERAPMKRKRRFASGRIIRRW
jgi:hypothetical protein